MSVSKRCMVLGASLAVAGLMLVLVIGLAGAAGGTWQSIGIDGGQVYQLVTANISPTLLYARAGDPMLPWAPAPSGIWKSADGGTTWQMTAVAVDSASGDNNLWTSAVAVSADGQTVYAATPFGLYSRIWRSADGGDSWSNTQVTTSSVQALAVFSNGRVGAGSANWDDRPLFYSNDGTTWPQATVTGPYTQANILTLAEGSMYAGGEADTTGGWTYVPAVYTSTNGINWTLAYTGGVFGPGGNRVIQIVADPSTANRAYALDDSWVFWGGDVYSTTNGGASWTLLANQPPLFSIFGAAVRSIAVDSQGRLYAAACTLDIFGFPMDCKVYRSTDTGATWGLVGETTGQKRLSSIVVDPNNDNILYFGGDDPDHSGGVYKTPSNYQVGAAAYQFTAANSGLRAYRLNDVANNSADPNTIYAATGAWLPFPPFSVGQGVIKSSDGGQSWSRTSEGVSNFALAVAVHPSNANIAYFGDWWDVYRTADGGNIWELRNTGLPGNQVQDLAIDPATPATLYAAIYNGGGGFEGVYKTTDSALNWTATTMVTPANAIAIHPTTPAVLYAAGDNAALGSVNDALYKSLNSGTSWTPLAVSNSCINDVIVNPITPTQVYATGCNGVFLRGTNDGANWTTYPITPGLGIATFSGGGNPGRLAYDSQAGVIYAAFGPDGLASSTDGGQTWQKSSPSMAMLSLFYQAADDTLFLGGSAGLWQMGGRGGVFLPIILKNY